MSSHDSVVDAVERLWRCRGGCVDLALEESAQDLKTRMLWRDVKLALWEVLRARGEVFAQGRTLDEHEAADAADAARD